MNKALNDYIVASRNNNISDEITKDTLLANGWELGEIEKEFIFLGGDKILIEAKAKEEASLKRKSKFATLSLILSISNIVYFLFGYSYPIIVILISVFGLILGVKGVRSNRKIQAIFGIILPLLTLFLIFINAIFIFNAMNTGNNVFTGEKLPDPQVNEFRNKYN